MSREEKEKCFIGKQEIEKLKKEEDCDEIKEKIKQLEDERKEIEKQEEKVVHEEKTAPWNVDTISKDGFTKTIINKPIPREDRSQLTEEELSKRYTEHCKKYEKDMKTYAMFSKLEDARRFLKENLALGKF